MGLEKNIVILDVEEYNRLRDFKKTILDDGIVINFGGFSSVSYFSRDKGLLELMDELKVEVNKNANLIKEIEKLKEELKNGTKWWPFR